MLHRHFETFQIIYRHQAIIIGSLSKRMGVLITAQKKRRFVHKPPETLVEHSGIEPLTS